MPIYLPEEIYAAARALLPELDEPLRRQVEALLEQAERGQATDLQILELLTAEESLRQRLRDLLKAGHTSRPVNASGSVVIMTGDSRTLGDYSPLPGSPSSTPGQVYVCLVAGCDYRYVISEAGEQPLPCPKHGQLRAVDLQG